jgi:hypothetical protein
MQNNPRKPADLELSGDPDSRLGRKEVDRGNSLLGSRRAKHRDWIWIAILIAPSLYLLLTLPPLWRDTDGFNEIASTFAPKGIIHWLPFYCFFGRLVMIAGGIIGNLLTGRGMPYLSIGTPELSEIGIYSLLIVQHLFLIYSLAFVIRAFTDRFLLRILFAGFFAITPWIYLFAQCIGTEAFSNPLVCLIAGYGWICVRTPELNPRRFALVFLLLLAAALTRHINLLMVSLLPLALLTPAVFQAFLSETEPTNGFRPWRKLFVSAGIGVLVPLASVGVQQAMCWMFRVPYRSTFGVTFEWRLNYLNALGPAERDAILNKVSTKVNDLAVTEAIHDLEESMDRKEANRHEGFLYERIDNILARSDERRNLQQHTFQIDSKLNRVAQAFLTPPDPALLNAVKNEVLRIPMLSQADLAQQPLELTDALQHELGAPRYARLRPLRSFQFPLGHYKKVFDTNAYFQLLKGVPMGVFALAGVAGGILVLANSRRSFVEVTGVCYAWSMIATGFLMAVGNCFSTSYGPRYFLPLYSFLQISLMLVLAFLPSVSTARRNRSRSATEQN